MLIIVTPAPVIPTQVHDAALSNPIGAPVKTLPWHELGLMVLAALVGWKGGERIGLFGALILGLMIVTAILSLAGLIISDHRSRLCWPRSSSSGAGSACNSSASHRVN